MMIIKEGFDPAKETYAVKCRRCGTEFEFDGSEAKPVAIDLLGERVDAYSNKAKRFFWDINCPTCETITRVDHLNSQRRITTEKLEEL